MNPEQARGLLLAGNEDGGNFGVVQNIGHAIERFTEVDWNRHRSEPQHREIHDVPFRAVWREDRDAVALAHTQIDQRACDPGDAAQQFFRGNVLPLRTGLVDLRAGRVVAIYRFEQPLRKGRVLHGSRKLYSTPRREATEAPRFS